LQSSKIRIAIQTAKASTLFDSQGSIAGPSALAKINTYVYKSFAVSAVLIGLMLLSIKRNSHRYPSANASTPFDSQGSIAGPPVVPRRHTYMYRSFGESAVLIGLMLLAIDCDLHRHSQRPFATTAATRLALKEVSSGHRHLSKYLSICIKASLKAPY
jgi:hypothetical protein